MRLMARLILYLAGSLVVISISFSYYQVYREKLNLKSELQRKADLLGDSLEATLAPLMGSQADLQRVADRLANKDHVAGIAVYDRNGARLAMTSGLSGAAADHEVVLREAMARNADFSQFLRASGNWMQVYAVPLHHGNAQAGALVIVHDANYIRLQLRRAWADMLMRLLIQISFIAFTTAFVIHRVVLRPMASTASWMRALRTGRGAISENVPQSEVFREVTNEAASMALTLASARASAEQEARLRQANDSSWTAQRLCVHLGNKLQSARLFIASNREPYMHVRKGKAIETVVPASGLVTALEPVLRACDGTWVAHGSGDADMQTVDARNRLRVPPDDPRYTLRRVWLTKEEEAGYYLGFANEGLWPLCHIAHTRPTFRAEDWEYYKSVNAKFADALLEEMAGVQNPVVVVQDYHFALLPRLLKQQRPDARVGIFWHIPWPNPEAFGICPWQREVLEGLLGADLIGFHIQMHCDNFLETVNSALEARVEWERFAVNREGHLTTVRPYPISVVFPEAPAELTPFHIHQAELLKQNNAEALYLGVGVDRVDYTKGILERLHAVERFLEKYPNYQGKFSFVQIGAPSRTNIKRYADFAAEVRSEAARINARFGRGKWQPILFRDRHHTHAEVDRFYRAADFCLVTSLHDGMNLVAKEYLAARHDEDGVLILSPFTGASRELNDALIVNPYDTDQLADAIHTALEMDASERRARMRRMRSSVRYNNVFRWAGSLIGELCDMRVAERKRPAPHVAEPREAMAATTAS